MNKYPSLNPDHTVFSFDKRLSIVILYIKVNN